MSELNEGFALSFEYNGKQYDLESRFVQTGYIHQFHILLNNDTLILEFDEERNYRVIAALPLTQSIDEGLLSAIADKAASLHL